MLSMIFYILLLGIAAVFTAAKLYSIFVVPAELKDVPAISFFGTLLSWLRREPFDVRFEKTIKPILKEQGVARLWGLGGWEVLVSKSHHVKEILSQTEKYPKFQPNDDSAKKTLFRKTLGFTNILHSDGSDWRHHRRIVNPAFKTSWSPEMFAQCTNHLIELIEASPGQAFQVHNLFRRLTLDVLGKGLFNYDFKAVIKGKNNPMLKLYNELMQDIFNPIYSSFPFLENVVPSRRISHHKSLEFRRFLEDIVTERKAYLNSDHNDLLALMIRASKEDKDTQYTEEDIVSDLSIFFIAGHDNTANILTTMFYFLAKHPEIQGKARQEVNLLLNFERRAPTIQELKEMPYVDCIIKESMRIFSTVTQLRRFCLDGDELSDGLVIPKQTFVSIQLWNLHHDEGTFPDPYSFNPDRFMDLHSKQNSQWMPFGGGTRTCLGKKFSLQEQHITIAMLLQAFTVHLGPESQKVATPKLSSWGILHLVGVDLAFQPIL